MTVLGAKGCFLAVLVTLGAPAFAAKSAETSKQVAVANPIEPSRFVLAAKPAVITNLVLHANRPTAFAPTQSSQFANGEVEYIEGPSWSYQTAHRGPVFEMAALGGGSAENAPFLAHVAMAWQF